MRWSSRGRLELAAALQPDPQDDWIAPPPDYFDPSPTRAARCGAFWFGPVAFQHFTWPKDFDGYRPGETPA